ncbi:MAG: glycosyltransferase [Ignavibacteria bacterium]|nr:glycosyltransferase [Ignavibacteria bacterium]
MRVLELIDGGFLGGGQTHILSLLRNFDKGKVDAVVSASGAGAFMNEVEMTGSRFLPIELPKLYRLKHLNELRKIIEEEDIDVLHSHGGVAGMYSGFYKKKSGKIPVVHTIHGIHYINSPNPLRRFGTLAIEQHLSKYRDAVICPSENDRRTAVELKIADPSVTVTIHNGIETQRFSASRKDAGLMNSLGLGQENFVIGLVSRFDEQKNQIFMLRHTSGFLRSNESAKMLFAGSGRLLEACRKAALEEGIEDKVIFAGEVADTEKYYPLIDLFVFPTLWEGFSIALLEAAASGRCILASGIAPNRELITDGVNGMLFDTGDPEGYLKHLELLFNDAGLRNRLAAEARSTAQNFTSASMTEKVMKIYERLAG